MNIGNGDQEVNYPNGMPNFIPFQVRPQPLTVEDCPINAQCCNNWTAQTGHTAMNIVMADGSVRSISPDVSATTWERLMLPRDGQVVGSDL